MPAAGEPQVEKRGDRGDGQAAERRVQPGGAREVEAGQLRAAIPALLAAVIPLGTDPELMATALIQDEKGGPGLLDGAAGIALALLSPGTAAPPRSAWDACLLIA